MIQNCCTMIWVWINLLFNTWVKLAAISSTTFVKINQFQFKRQKKIMLHWRRRKNNYNQRKLQPFEKWEIKRLWAIISSYSRIMSNAFCYFAPCILFHSCPNRQLKHRNLISIYFSLTNYIRCIFHMEILELYIDIIENAKELLAIKWEIRIILQKRP